MSQTPSLSEVVHPGVRCQKCGQDPIRGIRYKCGNCEDYDLCETCEISSETFHNPEHLFVKIKKPLVDAPSRRLLPNLYRSAGSPTMTPPHHVPFPAGPIAPGPLLEMLRAESARFGVEANNSFTTALFRMINETNRGSPHNILISPLSLSIAITSAGNGAEGSTLETIARPFGYMGSFTDANSAMINHACRQFLLHLASHARSSDVRCFMATSMWIPSALYPRVKGEFKQLVHESCACDVLPHPQEGPITPAVDEWAASRTGGLVRNVAPSLSPSLAMFNLCAFEGKWRVPFASELVDMTFTSFGQSQLVKMMRADGVFEHVQMEGFQACSLPYGHTDADKNTFKATVILPDTPDLLDVVADRLTHTVKDLCRALPKSEGRLFLPRFKVECEMSCRDALTQLGTRKIFEQDAEFSNIVDLAAGEKLCVSDLVHKATLRVTEDGVQSRDRTVHTTSCRVGPDATPWEMRCDRPFLFLVRKGNIIVLMGRIASITE